MSAGTGVQHAESNPQAHLPTHLPQIRIEPDTRGLAPGDESRTLAADTASHSFGDGGRAEVPVFDPPAPRGARQ
ncbi:MAG: hypothetical protein R3E68_08235 [Burkholderiaceae bacterium]